MCVLFSRLMLGACPKALLHAVPEASSCSTLCKGVFGMHQAARKRPSLAPAV